MTVSEDFTGVAGRFRGELLAHCYRMAGSAEEAEDLVQETYLRAWQSYDGFGGRSSDELADGWFDRVVPQPCTTIQPTGSRTSSGMRQGWPEQRSMLPAGRMTSALQQESASLTWWSCPATSHVLRSAGRSGRTMQPTFFLSSK
jgi:hypothetical protein